MSNALQPKPRIIGHKTRICIVASKYNEKFTDALVDNTLKELSKLIPLARVDVVRVPGAFEIPATLAVLLDRKEFNCIVALGLIIRGDTEHANLIGSSVTNALQTLAIQHKIPLIHEVLLVNDEKQAYARCIAANKNRGREAAKAAASMIDVFSKIDKTMPKIEETKKPVTHGKP